MEETLSLTKNICTDCGKLSYLSNGRCSKCEESHAAEGLGMMILIAMGIILGSLMILGIMVYTK